MKKTNRLFKKDDIVIVKNNLDKTKKYIHNKFRNDTIKRT